MKMTLLRAGLSALVSLTAVGCVAVPADRGALSQTLTDDKALYAVEAGVYGAEAAAEAATDAGLLRGAEAARVSVSLDQAHAVLLAARAAYAAGDAKSGAEKVATLQILIADILSLLPKKGA